MSNEIVSGKFGSLSPENYTMELISLCIESGMLNTAKQLEIKKALENEFTETAIQFTRSQSGSISESRAQMLASSVLYRSDVYLLSLRSHEKAASALVNMPMSSILKQGSVEILRLFEESMKIFRTAYNTRINADNHEYRYVTEKAYDDFRRNYSAQFDGAGCPCNIDYPLLGQNACDSKLKGVMFICDYYRCICLENELCRLFSEADIIRLLESYAHERNDDYRQMYLNIAEVIAYNLLGRAIIGKPLALELTENDVKDIESRCKGLTADSITSLLEKGLSAYYKAINSPPLYMYLRQYAPAFAIRLGSAVQSGGTAGVFTVIKA